MLKALVPISGDIAPMVYVNDTLYQIVDSQPNFADEKSSFNLLGKIENTVSSSEEPKENFQANDDIVLSLRENTGYMNTIITQTLTETQTDMPHAQTSHTSDEKVSEQNLLAK